MFNHISMVLSTLFLVSSLQAQAVLDLSQPAKHVISFGWDSPKLDEWEKILPLLEQSPFEGFGVRLPDTVAGGRIFRIDQWQEVQETDKQAVLEMARKLPRSAKVTQNFLVLYGESTFRWSQDGEWKQVEEQLRFASRVAKAAGFRGILWDPEPYGKHKTWSFTEQSDKSTKDYFEYSKTVVQRGKRWIEVIQEEFPNVVILSLRQLSDFQSGSPFSAKYFEMQDEKSRRELLYWSYWGLHGPFTVGILNGCRGNTVLHDGNEDAYYYTSALEFYRIVTQLRTLGRQMIPAASRPAFDRHYKVGHAVSVDYTAGNWAEAINFPNELRQQALQLSEQERAEWFEHNLYHALASTDQFVWVYSEKPSFWKQTDVPPGYHVAFELAVAKYRQGKPLGFSMEAKLEAARARVKAKEN